MQSWPKTTTRRPLSAWVVIAAAAQSTSAWAVPSVITGFRPVSGQVPTLRCGSRPYCASAPLTAWAKTTPGFGPLLPQVKLIGVSLGNCWSSEITLSCGNAQVSGAQTSTLTPASWNCLATRSACASPSTSVGAHTTLAGEPSGSLTRAASVSATILQMLTQRCRLSASMRGSPATNTPIAGVLRSYFVLSESAIALDMK